MKGADGTHFNRPTFLSWLPDSTLFVADGYNGTRVAKFDKNGKFLMDWGMKGTPPNDTRPYYMNNVHGMALDPVTKHVFVNDRGNHRFRYSTRTENIFTSGAWARSRPMSTCSTSARTACCGPIDRGTSKMLKYDLAGALPVFLGHLGRFPGRLLGRARIQRRSGRQFLRRRSGQRARAEVHSAAGRESGVPGQQADLRGMEISGLALARL